MSARDFSKVPATLWADPAFRQLSTSEKTGYLYLITNGHVTSAGCYRLRALYASDDLDWAADEWLSVRDGLRRAGWIDHDPDTDEVLVEGWFGFNAPMNDKHAKGTSRQIDNIKSERLSEKTRASFQAAESARLERQAVKELSSPQPARRSDALAASALVKDIGRGGLRRP